ncbi:MAG TPA: hypothetical protein PKM99_01305 [Thermotogota bacterium]|nr:hypothetical protein [Thermotogota bacterium]
MPNTIHLNFPLTIEQVEKLSKVVAITTASRGKHEENERITKASFVRVLIDLAPLDTVDYGDIRTEEDLKERLSSALETPSPSKPQKIKPSELAEVYNKFASDDNRKWVAGDFINNLFERGWIEAGSSEEMWAFILKNAH